MRKLLFLSLIIFSTLSASAQLTDGKYKILGVKGFRNGKTVYEQLFDEAKAIVRVRNGILNIVFSGYSTHTFALGNSNLHEGLYLYDSQKIQTGQNTSILFKKLEGYPELDGGMLIINHSDSYSDIFTIVKD